MTEIMDGQVSIFDQDTWSGKTYPEPSAATKDKTTQPSSKKRSASQNRKLPIFMCLKKDGLQQGATWMRMETGPWHGEFSMHSFGEHPISLYHNGVGESRLSQILEDSPHPKYSLSAKACQGILNRASRRGKELPELLRVALEEQCLALSKSEIQTDKSATLSTLQDQTLFQPVECYSINHQGGNVEQIIPDKAGTLTAAMNSSGNNKLSVAYCVEPTTVCLEGNGSRPSHKGDGYAESDVMYTLNTIERHSVVYGIGSYHSNAMKSDNPHSGIYEADTARTLDALQCGYPACNQGGMAVVQPVCCYRKGTRPHSVDEAQRWEEFDVSNTLNEFDTGEVRTNELIVAGVDCRNGSEHLELFPTLQAKPNGGQSLNYSGAVRVRHIVRRLTPLDCERLQGFPDGWTDIGDWVDSKGKKHKAADSPRYKALGNSIALPPWKWVLKRLCACYERDATMASLFDGIGGFPLIWEQLNGKGSCLWASEIEEFPMAVTKLRFGE